MDKFLFIHAVRTCLCSVQMRERTNTACTHSHYHLQGRRWKLISVAFAANAWPKEPPNVLTNGNRSQGNRKTVIDTQQVPGLLSQISLLSLPWSECQHIIIPAQAHLEKTGFNLLHRMDASSEHHSYLIRAHTPRLANPAASVVTFLLHHLLPFLLHFSNRKQNRKRKRGKMQTIKLFVKTRQNFE